MFSLSRSEYPQDLRDAVRTEIKNGGNAFALDIQLPKYEDLPFYKEWLPLNALMVAMNEFLGPLGWRPTNQKLSSEPDTRNSAESEPSSTNSVDVDLPLRSSIFSPVPPMAKSPSPAPVFSPSTWPSTSYSWRMSSYSPHHDQAMMRSHYENRRAQFNKWKSYLNSRRGSMWG